MMDYGQKACGLIRRLGAALALVLVLGLGHTAQAQLWGQRPRVNYRWSHKASPGEIGAEQVRQGVVPPGYFQPVRVLGPEGLRVGVRTDEGGEVTREAPADFALLVGAVYRLRLTGIPQAVGMELYPSVEVIDRLHPPQGSEGRHPIPLHLTQEDLELALTGRMVTKVIYLEQQDLAAPGRHEEGELPVYDATPEQNAVEAADVFGRPVAIVRIGNWMPLNADWSDDPLGAPPPVIFPIGNEADEVARGATRPEPQAAVRAGGPSSRVARTSEMGRAEVLFPPTTRQAAGSRDETVMSREGEAAGHEDAMPRGVSEVGWRTVTPRRKGSTASGARGKTSGTAGQASGMLRGNLDETAARGESRIRSTGAAAVSRRLFDRSSVESEGEGMHAWRARRRARPADAGWVEVIRGGG